jgi:hypothetical protein
VDTQKMPQGGCIIEVSPDALGLTSFSAASTEYRTWAGKSLSESEGGLAGEDSFLEKIEEINLFEEKDLDDEEGIGYGVGDNIQQWIHLE